MEVQRIPPLRELNITKTPLRVCRGCGLEAWTQDDLEKFRKAKRSQHGRENKCKPCANKDPAGMRMRKRVVTDDMVEALKEAHKNGETVISVAQRFNVSVVTLYSWAHNLGLKFIGNKRRHSPEIKINPSSPFMITQMWGNPSETKKKRRKPSKQKEQLNDLHLTPQQEEDEMMQYEGLIVNDYMNDMSQSWKQLADKHGGSEKIVKIIIGEHLMRACRAEDACPYKPLLPENSLQKKVDN